MQQRKKEEAARQARRDARPVEAPRPETILSTFAMDKDAGIGAEELAATLNEYFAGFLSSAEGTILLQPAVIEKYPLYLYDSSEFDEGKKVGELTADKFHRFTDGVFGNAGKCCNVTRHLRCGRRGECWCN